MLLFAPLVVFVAQIIAVVVYDRLNNIMAGTGVGQVGNCVFEVFGNIVHMTIGVDTFRHLRSGCASQFQALTLVAWQP